MLKSLIIAFSMYSKIPMPRVDWDERSARYALCFFPLVGAAVGAVLYFAGALMLKCGAGALLFSAVMTVIPILITGGIHLDGFIDMSDALSSYGDIKKRLEIMQDPHVGAFAVIKTAVYFVLCLGLWSCVGADRLIFIAVGCVLSRALSGLSVICFRCAKPDGLARMFSDAAQKRVTAVVLSLWIGAAICVWSVMDIKRAAVMCGAALLVFVWHYINCRKHFGGITGDLAGAFLELCELALLAAAVI